MNELTGMETLTAGQEAASMKEEIASLKAIVKNLTQKLENAENQITSLRLVTETLKIDTDTPKSGRDTEKPSRDTGRLSRDTGMPGGDTGKPSGDTEKSGADTEKSGADTEKSGADTEKSGADTGKPGDDTENHSGDTKRPDGDTQTADAGAGKAKIANTVKTNQNTENNAAGPQNSSTTVRSARSSAKNGIVEILQKIDQTSSEEITQVLDKLNAVTLGAYEKRVDLNLVLDTLSSYISKNSESSDPDLIKRITEEKLFLTIKREIFLRLRRLDLMRSQSDRLTREVIFMVQESSPDMKMLMAKFRVPRITICRDLKVFNNIGWVKTVGWGAKSKYALTDEARAFISKVISEYKK